MLESKYNDIAALTQAGLNLIQQALSIYDSDLRFVVGNRTFQTMFALPDHLVTRGAHFEDVIRFLTERGEYGEVADHDAFVRDKVEQALAFEPHYMERERADGRMVSVEGSPLAQGGWVTVYTDITAIKRQEQLLRSRSEELSDQLLAHAEELSQTNRALAATNAALQETKHQLTEMESRARVTAEMMPAHIARIDRDWRYSYSNRQLANILPSTPRDLVGLPVHEALGDEAFERITPNLERAFAGEASVLEFAHEGAARRIRVAFTPDVDEAGDVTGIYVLSMDVTEEAQARAALTQTRKRELAAQLTSGMAHDFSNLLTIILGMQARLGQMDLPDEARALVEATTGAARRGGAILDRISSMTGAREVRPEPVEVAGLLAEIETLGRATLPDGITLTTQADGLDHPVLLDIGATQDALLNLVLNARDAIEAAGGRIDVRARAVGGTWIEFEVTDTGPGFSDKALDHALDAFFTTKGGEGSGLGLAMVYDHAKMSGGHVRLGNGPKGARVTIRLPLKPAQVAGTPKLVLLVEDQEDIRADVRGMLVALGHQVIEAVSGEEALDLGGIEEIDVVLSDIMLGGAVTGDTLAGRMDAPVLLMSSLPANDARRTGRPVLSKPFTRGQLSAFLTESLDREAAE
ncbi:MAG: PAS-domain containing protein [Pseudomonadota bacterium]|nr:PAS-domain containing protein [Pseudomonadota bacterium]